MSPAAQGCRVRLWTRAQAPLGVPGASAPTVAATANATIAAWTSPLDPSGDREIMVAVSAGPDFELADASGLPNPSSDIALSECGETIALAYGTAVDGTPAISLAWGDGSTTLAPLPALAPRTSMPSLTADTSGCLLGFVSDQADGQVGSVMTVDPHADPGTTAASVAITPVVDAVGRIGLATAANTDAIAVALVGRADNRALVLAERAAGGAFEIRDLSIGGGPVTDGPVSALGARGAGVMAWTERLGDASVALRVAERDSFGAFGHWQAVGTPSFAQSDGTISAPVVAFAGDEVHLAWVDASDSSSAVRVAHRNASGAWDRDRPQFLALSDPLARASTPRLAVGPYQETVLLWVEEFDQVSTIKAARRSAGADAWLPADLIASDAHTPALAIASDGRAVVAFLAGPPAAARVGFVTLEP